MINHGKWLNLLASLALVSAAAGCSGYDGAVDENVDSVSQAFNTSQCATAGAVATFTGQYTWGSPSSYGTACNAVDETTGGSGLYIGYSSEPNLNALPTNQATCEQISIRSVFYTWNGSAWILQSDQSLAATWGPDPFGTFRCLLDGTFFPPPGGGTDVRVATTVRRGSGSTLVTYPFTTLLRKKPT